jgi:diguanylate cyclase (GGDEF)-like protein
MAHTELPFDGFESRIQIPLEQSDPKSYGRIKRALLDLPSSMNDEPFRYLIKRLSGKTFMEHEARKHWHFILDNKKDFEAKLGRTVSIQTAAVDYFDSINMHSRESERPNSMSIGELEKLRKQKLSDTWITKIYDPSYHIEKLKEEMLRSKRYNHSLSTILLDVDEFHKINENLSYKAGDMILSIIVKIIRNLIRNVDIIARYSGDRFLIILPSTNEREAAELAERLRKSIVQRTNRIDTIPRGVTATFTIGQCSGNDSSRDFIKRLENALEEGKREKRNAVYSIK